VVTLPHLPSEIILQRASLASVAVESPFGAHVTVQAFAWSAGRVWLVAPTDSLKVRAITPRPVIGVTVSVGNQHVIMCGDAELIDGWPPKAGSLSPRLPFGLGWYFARNAAITAGILTDLLSGDLPGLSARTLISFAPRRSLTIDNDRIVHRVGDWPDAPIVGTTRVLQPIDTHTDLLLPSGQELVRNATHANVGWPTADGPVAVPATIINGLAAVSPSVATVLGNPTASGALTVHASAGNRPSRYSGVMLRGPLLCVPPGAVGLDVERITWWEGYTSTTVPVTAKQGKSRRPTR
jgi:hypothetical protein